MRILTSLGAWFCLPQFAAGEMNIVGMDLGSGALGPYDLVFPCPSTLPMGFSWSVYLCHRAGEALFTRATRLERCPLVNDRDQAPVFHESPGGRQVRIRLRGQHRGAGHLARESKRCHRKGDDDFRKCWPAHSRSFGQRFSSNRSLGRCWIANIDAAPWRHVDFGGCDAELVPLLSAHTGGRHRSCHVL